MDGLKDGRRHPFFVVDNALLISHGANIGAAGIAVYAVIAMHAGPDGGGAFPSYTRIAELTGLSRSSVIRTTRALHAAALIAKAARFGEDGSQTSNDYTLLPIDRAGVMEGRGGSQADTGPVSVGNSNKNPLPREQEQQPGDSSPGARVDVWAPVFSVVEDSLQKPTHATRSGKPLAWAGRLIARLGRAGLDRPVAAERVWRAFEASRREAGNWRYVSANNALEQLGRWIVDHPEIVAAARRGSATVADAASVRVEDGDFLMVPSEQRGKVLR